MEEGQGSGKDGREAGARGEVRAVDDMSVSLVDCFSKQKL